MYGIYEKPVGDIWRFIPDALLYTADLPSGAVRVYRPDLREVCRKALRLCVNLVGFTWSDESSDIGDEGDFMEYLDILQTLPLRELIIRTFYGLSDSVWARLQDFTALHKVSIWCMEGKPRILQGWSEKLGSSLTHLELGVSPLSPAHPIDCAS